jgi:phenylalanyl-tRNA synthetase alpha chain
MNELKSQAITEIGAASDLKGLEELRVKYLGKKGLISSQMSAIGALPPEEKKAFGAKVNEVKTAVEAALDEKKQVLELAEINSKLANEKLDVTLSARPRASGKIHPLSQVMAEVTGILGALGFEQKEGPNVEDDYHNFTALNFPENHPARQMHDTFFLPGNMLLRTHTSSVQIRAMANLKPPFRIFSMGRTYRCDSDMTHTPMFHQVEVLYVDKKVNMAQLKWTLNEFIGQFFGPRGIRLRPSFFPFTEPSAEVDIEWENGKWLEVLGAGMVHPNVLKNAGIDPNVYSGFAFGAGLERMAMLKYNIPDLRQFFESDVRWLNHYGFGA